MEKYTMENKIDELFETIKNSSEYLEYQEINNLLKNNEEINNLIENIKELQKKSTKLEHNNNLEYKELDKEIEKKITQLHSYPIYIEYLNKMNELNDILAMSSNMIEKYIEEVIN